MRREIVQKWTCQRSGDCCLTPALVCTPQEVAAMRAAKDLPLDIEPISDALVRINTPHGCPYLAREMGGQSVCTIYEARPYNCRRFGCFRPDPKTEPYEVGGPLGCRNLSDRLDSSRLVFEQYRTMQRIAQRDWANHKGWLLTPLDNARCE